MEDLDVNRFRLEKMFSVELEALIDAGDLSKDDMSALEEAIKRAREARKRSSVLGSSRGDDRN